MTTVDTLKATFPAAASTIDRICQIHRLVDSLPIASFFEPKTCFVLGDKPQPLILDADVLATWIQHISHGARVRLRSLEHGFLSELNACRLMTAMILARSHMEVAGLAAYAEHALLAASETGKWDDLKPIIHQMLFGTSFRFEKQLQSLQDELPLEATIPVRPKLLLEAMDDFLTAMSDCEPHCRGLYALLCEYAHPNIGGAKAFAEVTRNVNGTGWHHQYRRDEDISEHDVVRAAEILLTNMKIGYTHALLLVTGEIEETADGIRFHKPSLSIGNTLWNEILKA